MLCIQCVCVVMFSSCVCVVFSSCNGTDVSCGGKAGSSDGYVCGLFVFVFSSFELTAFPTLIINPNTIIFFCFCINSSHLFFFCEHVDCFILNPASTKRRQSLVFVRLYIFRVKLSRLYLGEGIRLFPLFWYWWRKCFGVKGCVFSDDWRTFFSKILTQPIRNSQFVCCAVKPANRSEGAGPTGP